MWIRPRDYDASGAASPILQISNTYHFNLILDPYILNGDFHDFLDRSLTSDSETVYE